MQLVDLAVGSLVKDPNTTYNNEPIIWRVLEHGHTGDPSGSTALEARDILTLKCFDAKEPNNSDSNRQSYGNNRYLYSNILQWLNSDAAAGQWYSAQHTADQAPDSANVWQNSGTAINPYDSEAGFLTFLSTQLKSALMTVSKTTVKNTVTDGGGSEAVSSKIFLLSTTEVGLANENSIAEGSKYSLYNTASYRVKNLMNNAAKGNYSSATSPWYWWLRTPYSGGSRGARRVYTDGMLGSDSAYNGINGVSPAICIPADTEVSSEPDSDGAYELFAASTPTVKLYVPHNGITTLPKKIYVGVNGLATPVSKIYTGINGEAVKIYDAGGASGGGIYGAEWDGSSVTTWTRTDDAANFPNPNPYYAGMSGTPSSPFDNISPWADMKIVEDSAAGTLVEIPKFYYKWSRTGSAMKLQISTTPFDGSFVSPAHADRGDGVGERDVVYVGRYHCASDYKSKTGVKPLGNKTRSVFRSGIHNLGSTIWQYDFAMYWTICMLYLVEFADWNSQNKIGYGCSNNSGTENMGSTDSMTYHTGTNAANRTTYGHTQYRYIEGLWDNVYDWCDGIYFAGTSNADVYCIKNPASFSDTTGGTKVGTRATTGGYEKAFTAPSASGFEYALYPNSVDSNLDGTTYTGDYCVYNASGVVLYVGGDYYQNQYYGLFYLYGYYAATYKSADIGSRLMKLP